MPYADEEKRKRHYKQYMNSQKFRVYDWKRKGIKLYDEDEIYKRYINADLCELCNIKMDHGNKSGVRRCLDHDHLSGHIRFVCCNKCNAYLRRIDTNKLKLNLELHRYFLTR